MRILHLISTLDPRVGGPANSIRRIVATYPEFGSEGEVATLDDPAAPFLEQVSFKVHALGPAAGVFAYSPALVPWLKANRHRFDGVVVHGLWQYLGVAVRRAISGHKPYMVFTHGMLDPYFKRAYPAKHLKKVPYWLLNEFWVLRGASHVLFTSTTESQLAPQSFWPSRWSPVVVPYGASASPDDPNQLRQAFLAAHPSLRKQDGTPRRFLLFLSRINPKKGCDLLVESFLQLAAGQPDLHLVFAGPLDSPSSLEIHAELTRRAEAASLSDRIHWIGMVEDSIKWGAFYASEAFCLPSHQENFGIAVAEALACGKPVLISDQVNIWPEIIDDGAGLVGPDTLAGTLSTLTRWLALSEDERASMSARALDCFKRRYDMRENARSIIRIFARTTASQVDHS